jgi:hypothetical protein
MADGPCFPQQTLQREQFRETLHLKALRIPKKECNEYMKLLKGYKFLPVPVNVGEALLIVRRLLTETRMRRMKANAVVLLNRYVFDRPRMRSIMSEKDKPDTRLLLLAERVQDEGANDMTAW